jgi:hypothetical protein
VTEVDGRRDREPGEQEQATENRPTGGTQAEYEGGQQHRPEHPGDLWRHSV